MPSSISSFIALYRTRNIKAKNESVNVSDIWTVKIRRSHTKLEYINDEEEEDKERCLLLSVDTWGD